ncbi:hypothetical protein AA18895_0165 [Acetobacter ghanensis DSM 18895]|nr:hypothetical protein AA18895_0165 [Acetobacter ghanensis DSM 18895]
MQRAMTWVPPKNCRLSLLLKPLRWQKQLRQQAEAFKNSPVSAGLFFCMRCLFFAGNGMFCHAPCKGRVAVF